MRRRWLGMGALVWEAVTVFSVPASTQVRGGRRLEAEMFRGREVSAREVLVRFRNRPTPVDLSNLRSLADSESLEGIGGIRIMRLRSRSMGAQALLDLLSQ